SMGTPVALFGHSSLKSAERYGLLGGFLLLGFLCLGLYAQRREESRGVLGAGGLVGHSEHARAVLAVVGAPPFAFTAGHAADFNRPGAGEVGQGQPGEQAGIGLADTGDPCGGVGHGAGLWFDDADAGGLDGAEADGVGVAVVFGPVEEAADGAEIVVDGAGGEGGGDHGGANGVDVVGGEGGQGERADGIAQASAVGGVVRAGGGAGVEGDRVQPGVDQLVDGARGGGGEGGPAGDGGGPPGGPLLELAGVQAAGFGLVAAEVVGAAAPDDDPLAGGVAFKSWLAAVGHGGDPWR
ncbi:MAG: hypothetical protein ACK5X3_00770, partial [Pseudomonadota bacterium]